MSERRFFRIARRLEAMQNARRNQEDVGSDTDWIEEIHAVFRPVGRFARWFMERRGVPGYIVLVAVVPLLLALASGVLIMIAIEHPLAAIGVVPLVLFFLWVVAGLWILLLR